MPIDASIPLQVRPAKFDNPQEIQARGLQIRQLMRADESAQRAEAEQQTLRNLYRQSLKADGNVDSQRFVRGVAEAGLGDKIPGIQKDLADARSATTKADESDLNLHKNRLDKLSGGLAALLANPNVTHDDVIAQINRFVDNGLITPEQGAEAARNTPGRPEQLRPFLVQKALEASDASKQLDLILPKFNEQNRGGTINEGTIDPLTGQRTAGTDVQRTVSPEAQLAADTAEKLGAVSYQTDAQGNFVALPTKPGAGPIRTQPVVDDAGNPVGGKPKALTDGQSKALLFGTRAQEADKVLESLAAKGVTMPSVTKQAAEKVPVVGGLLAAGANAVAASPEQQQVEQAQRDFINATLRRESGATIQQSEFDNANKQYFPQIGDSPEVIAQKARNRALAINGMLIEVPENMRTSITPGAQPPQRPAAPSGARPPLDAIFKRKP